MSFANRAVSFFHKVVFGGSPRLYGRFTSGAGVGEEIGIGAGLVIEGGSLKAVSVNLGNLTTSGFTTGHMLRIASGGGLEGRTPAQVLADIGGQATLSNYSTITALTGYPSTFPPTIGSGPGEAVAGNDSRLHAAATVSGNGIQITGQQISLSIGTGATQIAAGNHTHSGVYQPVLSSYSTISGLSGYPTAFPTNSSNVTDATNTGTLALFGNEKVVKWSTDGGLTGTSFKAASISANIELGATNITATNTGGTQSLAFTPGASNYTATLPGKTGTLAMTSDLHDAVTVTGNGISLSGQQISLSIGPGANQVAAGNHTHTAAEVGAVGLTGNEMVGGNKNLAGQTTMPNQTAGTGDSAMNRNLAAAMFAMSPAVHQINTFTGGTVTGVGTTVNSVHPGVIVLTITNVSNASARVKLCEDFGFGDANAGYTFGFSTPFSLRVPLAFGGLDANGSFVMRIYACTQGTMTLPAAGADPYPANTRGICAELRQKSSGTGWEARLCARNGTASDAGTFITSSWYEISPNNITKHYDLVITSNGAGNAKLFCTAFAMVYGEYPQTWQTTPLITLTGTGVPMTNENVATFWSRPELAVIGDGVATTGGTRYIKLFQCCAVYGVAF